MGEQFPLIDLVERIRPNLVSCKSWGDATFMSLPLVYPSGSFVTVRLTHADDGVRVSDSGFAYREAESFGAGRSFSGTARSIADRFDVEVGRRSIFADVSIEEVERAILDVSSASNAVADRIVSNAAQTTDADIADALHEKLDRVFPTSVEHDGKIVGASSMEWDVTAVARTDEKRAVFQLVANYPVAVFRTSTAFHDLSALDNPPSLISVVTSKADMGKNYSILAQAGRVIEIGQDEGAFRRAAA